VADSESADTVPDMPQDEFLESAVRSSGDLAGVFEHDGETGYFYLYAVHGEERKILGALHVLSGRRTFEKGDVQIRWDATESVVGLLIGRRLWAAFDSTTGAGYGGDYAAGVRPDLPPRISAALCGR